MPLSQPLSQIKRYLDCSLRPLPTDSFLLSPAYYALTGRRGAWLCERNDNKVVICQHPHFDNHLMIFPEIGAGDGSLIASLISQLNPQTHTIQLARFCQDRLNAVEHHLKKQGLILRQEVEKVMDWQYPLHILDTEKIARLDGSDFRNIRQKYRKIDRAKVKKISLQDETALRALKACTKYWQGNQILYNKMTDAPDDGFYQALFSCLEHHPSLFDGFLLFYNERIAGFSIWDTPTHNETVNLIANLVDIHWAGLAEYQLVTTCDILQKKGIRFLNRGGSEQKGLDDFKKKFSPVKSIMLYSAFVETPKKSVFFYQNLVENSATPTPLVFA